MIFYNGENLIIYGYLQTYNYIPRGEADINGYYQRCTDEEIIKFIGERLQKIKERESIIAAFNGLKNYMNTPEDQLKPKLIELAKQRKIEWSTIKHMLTKDELKKYTGGIYREKFGI